MSCGMIRYSAAPPVAGKTVQPEPSAGSNEPYSFTARMTLSPAAVQAVMLGSTPLVHAAPASNHTSGPAVRRALTHPSRFPNMTSPRSFSVEPWRLSRATQRPMEADRPGKLVHPDHRDDQRLQRHTPLRERAPQDSGERDGQSTL